ncbi:hypothetical protein Tco_0766210 [Tanacetum coccineum]
MGIMVLALETSKDAHAAEILNLKTRIQKLEKKCKPSISHHRAWLRSVSRFLRKKKLGKQDSVSKQGRKNTKSGPKLDDSTFDDLDADLAHGMDYMETEEAMNEGRQSNETKELNLDLKDKGSGEKGGSTVSTARPKVDTARPDINTPRPEVHTANAPISTAGVTISTADPEVSTIEPRTPPTTTSIFDDKDITLAQTLIKIKEEKSKEKGVSFKDVKDSSRPVRSITTLKPVPSIDPKDKGKGILVEEEPVKIKRKDQGIDQIERDEELAYKLHEEELAEIARIQEEKAAQEEASRFALMEMFDEVQEGIDADVLFAAKLQQEEIKEYTIEERAKFLAGTIAAQTKFRVAQRAAEIRNSDDAVKDSKKAAGEDTSKKEEVLKEPDSTKIESMNKEDAGERVLDVSKKRKGGPRMKRMSKRKKTKYGADGIYYKIFRSDGSSRYIKIFSEMGDLRIIFDANTEDEIWQNQERWNLKSWNFYENCGVHTLTLEDGTEIHMLAERKYPLTKETLERMMSLKLIAESASDGAYDLLRFIQKQIDEAGSHDGGKKDL